MAAEYEDGATSQPRQKARPMVSTSGNREQPWSHVLALAACIMISIDPYNLRYVPHEHAWLANCGALVTTTACMLGQGEHHS